MNGIEINFVVTDSLSALRCYESIFEVKRLEVTNLPKGENEVLFSIDDVHFHMLDENPKFQLVAPKENHPITMWFNVTVTDIRATYKKAIDAGCIEVQPVVELAGYGVSNASFIDPWGYHWMLHQNHHVVSHEDHIQLWEDHPQ